MSCLVVREKIFSGKNNTFTSEYEQANFDFSLITRVTFELNSKVSDSDIEAALFDFSGGVLGTGPITFKLGNALAAYVAADSGQAEVTVYDAVNTDGIVLASTNGPTQLEVTVI